jgi:hypothetical protein
MITARRITRLALPAAVVVAVAACSGAETGAGDGDAQAISINGCDPDTP